MTAPKPKSSTHKIPKSVLEYAREITGLKNPWAFLDELWFIGMETHKARNTQNGDTESTQRTESKPNPLVKPELHVAVDWNKYGMGFDIEDPDFTDVILPWFIEIKGGEKQAEARIIEKMSQKNPITNPRAWVADLYYKNKKRDAG